MKIIVDAMGGDNAPACNVKGALDAVTEQRVLERLNALPGRVCIAITHRPAALALSDRQMVIADGKITVQTLRKEEKAWIR